MSLVSCRKGFTDTLLSLARENPALFAVVTDSRGSVTLSEFARQLPEQFLELGIAEQNAVTVAAGLASTGQTVFAAGPACFITARAYEQVKVDVAYNQTNVKLVGVSAGVSYGPLGGTHTALHDFAGLRALPGVELFAPCDYEQAAAVTRHMASSSAPAYMRTGRGDVEAVYTPGEVFTIGQAKLLRCGSDVTLIACGEALHPTLAAAALLEADGISARVLDMFTLRPLDTESVIAAARETRGIVTVEEHSVHGGLGEAVAHVTAEHAPVRMAVLGFPDEECMVGRSGDLFKHYGLTAKNIAARARVLLDG